MPMFYGQIMMQKYLEDPALSFCAIGDVTCDQAPLQVAEFGQGKGIDQMISKMYLEGGGGGNKHESYDLAGYFYSTHIDLINPEIPFFFVTGDEGYWETTSAEKINKIFGKGIKEKQINSNEHWKALLKNYNVFHIKKPFYDSKSDKVIKNQWTKTLGEERVLDIVTPKACVDVMLGSIALTSGARDMKGYIKDMRDRGQSEDRIKEVTNALKKYNDKLVKGQIKVIRHKVNILDLHKEVKESIDNIQKTSDLKTVSKADVEAVAADFHKLFLEDYDESAVKQREEYAELRKQKGDEIPKEFLCPITNEIIFDPVITSDGITFEKKAIELWLEKHDYSPVTGKVLESKICLSNFALKQLIRDYVEGSK
jgi:hypothetical protein